MKKFLVLSGLALVVIVTVAACIFAYSKYEESQYTDSAVPYVKMVVPEISKWDVETIKRHMNAESLEATSEERISGVLQYLSRLGALKEAAEPRFSKVFTGPYVEGVRKTFVAYKIDAIYENGDAVITLNLLDNGGSYQVYKFDIKSAALTE
ncbi:MAG TPA: hypothetical protein VIR78_13550 [Malonomonas sp.]